MDMQKSYPVMQINLSHLYENAKNIIERCKNSGISVTCVVKGTDSYEHSYNKIAKVLLSAGCISIGDSRMNTIKRMRELGFDKEIILLRIPMLSEMDDVIAYANCSLQSGITSLRAANEAAKKANKIHDVILMMDLGDLREGFFDEGELMEAAIITEHELSNLHLKGIGTNLGCYGSICPDETNLGRLISIAKKVEEKINRKLELISGGATSTLPLLLEGKVPQGINHLRIGEGIPLPQNLIDLWECNMPYMHRDVYTIFAEVIEVRNKPSYPIGRIFIDAFGNRQTYEDRGIRKRALLAIGKRDIGDFSSLTPYLEGASILGGSSDHLILDVEDVKEEVKIGDIIAFDVSYGGMVFANNSSSVTKEYIE